MTNELTEAMALADKWRAKAEETLALLETAMKLAAQWTARCAELHATAARLEAENKQLNAEAKVWAELLNKGAS